VYPWDGYASGTLSAAGGASDAPDSATFKFWAQTYADAHTTMSTSGVGHNSEWRLRWERLEASIVLMVESMAAEASLMPPIPSNT
jgi:hypothetical protein